MNKSMLINISLSLISIVITLLAVDVAFYYFFPQPTYAVRYSPWGFEHIPNISFKHTNESKEAITYVQYNSQGFRSSEEFDFEKPETTLRIAILGDSYAEGIEVNFSDLHSTLLQLNLSDYYDSISTNIERVEVINAGVYAYESCQELRLFQERVLKFNPDIVLLIYTQELDQNNNFCKLNGQKLEYIDFEYSRAQYTLRNAAGFIKAKSHLLNFLNRVYLYSFGGYTNMPEQLFSNFTYLPPDDYEYTISPKDPSKPFSEYTTLNVKVDPLPTSDNYRLLFSIFKEFDNTVKGYGGKFGVVFSHTEPAITPLGHFLDLERIPFFDLNSYIQDSQTAAAHFEIDGHWNSYGHFLTARGLSEFVLEMTD